jgi:hypothetical protein
VPRNRVELSTRHACIGPLSRVLYGFSLIVDSILGRFLNHFIKLIKFLFTCDTWLLKKSNGTLFDGID